MSRALWAATVAGALFGAGLALSGMTDARRVLGFLDVAGDFDPTLMWVLASAMLVSAVGQRWVLRRTRPWCAARFQLPTVRDIDARLLLGAALFGIGWGWAGYCPGPAIAGLAVASREALWFVPAMLLGFWLHDRFVR
ncbi:TPA: YeeE/YedE family protein [Stenotrophomonas maltophilia]|nr:YeeE/YedE family protein [Stenotrophomonas maltophilia]